MTKLFISLLVLSIAALALSYPQYSNTYDQPEAEGELERESDSEDNYAEDEGETYEAQVYRGESEDNYGSDNNENDVEYEPKSYNNEGDQEESEINYTFDISPNYDGVREESEITFSNNNPEEYYEEESESQNYNEEQDQDENETQYKSANLENDEEYETQIYEEDQDQNEHEGNYYSENGDEEENEGHNYNEEVIVRKKRQHEAGFHALGLSGSHYDFSGKPRPVGKIHGAFNGAGSSPNFKDYKYNAGVGAGSVLFRSKNKQHSIGAGAYIKQSGSRFGTQIFKTKPDLGVGLGYTFNFK